MYICIYIYIYMRRTHAPTCCVRARVRVRFGAHASVPTRASAFRRRGSRVARLAGVLLGVGVQRQHRRVEHGVGHHLVPCMLIISYSSLSMWIYISISPSFMFIYMCVIMYMYLYIPVYIRT